MLHFVMKYFSSQCNMMATNHMITKYRKVVNSPINFEMLLVQAIYVMSEGLTFFLIHILIIHYIGHISLFPINKK